MTKRIAKLTALLGAGAALMVGGIGIAQASNGADDPPGHHLEHRGHKHKHHGKHHHSHAQVRGQMVVNDHGSRGHGADDGPGDDHGSGGHGADDGPGDDHGGHGADDGPNHT